MHLMSYSMQSTWYPVCIGRHDDGSFCIQPCNIRGLYCDDCDPAPDIRRNLENDYDDYENIPDTRNIDETISVPEGNKQIECPICYVKQSSQKCIKLRCNHIFCGVCLVKTKNRLCPFCRIPFTV